MALHLDQVCVKMALRLRDLVHFLEVLLHDVYPFKVVVAGILCSGCSDLAYAIALYALAEVLIQWVI